jgi:hypothetical protein
LLTPSLELGIACHAQALLNPYTAPFAGVALGLLLIAAASRFAAPLFRAPPFRTQTLPNPPKPSQLGALSANPNKHL